MALQYASILSSWQLAFFMTWSITSCESPPHVEAFDTYLDGDLEAAKQGLVLGHVEMEAHGVLQVLPEGWDE
jgi:hypothetical protein